MAISDYSATAASNATVLGINIGEGCAPGNVNNAIRQLCADIAAGINFDLLASFLSSTTLDQARDALGVQETNPEGLNPAGSIICYAGATAPTGYLECDGSAVSRSTYATLFAAIGSTYGAGNGSTTFNLPDLRGEFVRGWDHGRGVDSGRVRGSAQSADVAAHSHGLRVYDRADTDSLGSGGGGDNTVSTGSSYVNGYIESVGGTETRPRNIAMMMCIKT